MLTGVTQLDSLASRWFAAFKHVAYRVGKSARVWVRCDGDPVFGGYWVILCCLEKPRR